MPVEIASGKVALGFDDVSVPGKVKLAWDRHYSPDLLEAQPSLLGRGWTSTFCSTLTRRPGGFEFTTPRGTAEWFADPDGIVERGGRVIHFGEFLEVFQLAGRYVVQSWDVESEEIWRYCFVPGRLGETWTLASLEDPTGQGLDLYHDAAGRLASIRQRLEQRELVLRYDSAGFVDAVTLHGSKGQRRLVVGYEHDSNGALIAVYDAAGNPDRYEYDERGRVVREVVKDGGIFTYLYDSDGRCVRMSGLGRYDEKQLRYLTAARVTEKIDSYGAATHYEYTSSGQISRESDPLGGIRTKSYDESGRLIAETGPLGATTRYDYDARGNRCEIVDALGNATRLTFNDTHQPTSITDANGNRWTRRYDGRNRLVSKLNPPDAHWQLRYDDAGNCVAVIDPKGHARSWSYEAGVVTAHTDWAGNVTHVGTDDRGLVVAEVDPLGRTYEYSYNPLGNLTKALLPDGTQQEVVYNAAGNVVKFTDGAGRITTRRFGSCNRILESIDAEGHKVKFSWGTEPGRLERVVNEQGEVFRFDYNECGDCVKQVSFDGRQHEFFHNLAGEVIRSVNGAGETVEVQRDPLGRITAQTLPDGSSSEYVYDSLGNLIQAVNAEGIVRLERDSIGRLVREEQGEHWLEYAVDQIGQVTAVRTDLGHSVQYDLDPNGLWNALRTADGATWQFRHDASGQEVQRTMPGGVQLEQRYDSLGQLAAQRVSTQAGAVRGGDGPVIAEPRPLVRREYGRDRSSLLREVGDLYSGTKRLTYDSADRLRAVGDQRGPSERFDYDTTGNLTRIVAIDTKGVSDQDLTYDVGSRLANSGSTTYQYDGQGRTVAKVEGAATASARVWRYEWDALDQLSSVTRPDGEVWRYGYDALGRRVRKTHSTGSVRFVWDGLVPVHQISSQTRSVVSWIYEQDSFAPAVQIRDGQACSIIGDHLGTPQEMVDGFGSVVWRFRCKAYGAESVQVANGDSCALRFQGQYYDAESGLHYSLFRYYDPDIGRFISQDPIGLAGGTNLYQYVHDPFQWIDPLGLADDARAGKRLADEGGVRIQSHGTNDVDRPAHAHVTSPAGETRIGPNGHPLAGQRPLTAQEKAVVANNLPAIRKELKKVGRAAARLEAKGQLPGAEGSSKAKTC